MQSKATSGEVDDGGRGYWMEFRGEDDSLFRTQFLPERHFNLQDAETKASESAKLTGIKVVLKNPDGEVVVTCPGRVASSP